MKTTHIEMTLRYDTTDPAFAGWYAEWRDDPGEVVDSLILEAADESDLEAAELAYASKQGWAA